MGQLLEGDKAYEAAKVQLYINLDSSVEMIEIMVDYIREKGEDNECGECERLAIYKSYCNSFRRNRKGVI